ncbi:MAG: hypothetical protein HWD86_10000 [Kangiellaceae bacterium]|nr:hypothetical protein [Kangiellaceae bacterium]
MQIVKISLLTIVLSLLAACGGGSDTPANQAPTANAGADQTVSEGDTVNLTGSGSDSDGTIASYSWSQQSGPSVSLSSNNQASTSFTAPSTNSSATVVLRLTVTDNDGATGSDTVSITINTNNQTPTANAGANQTVDEQSQVTLDASASSDSDGSIASYSWSQTAGSNVTLSNASAAMPSFTAPAVSANEVLTFSVTVTDDRGATDSDTVNITVQPVAGLNQAPTANAGADQTVNGTDSVTLDGAASSDSDGSIASYSWSQTAGTNVTLSNASSASATFTAPDVANQEALSFQLVVTDNEGATSNDSVTITVNPKPAGTTLSGKVTYDNVPHNTSTNGLNYAATTQDPVRGATIQLLQGSTVLETSVTDANGDYSFVAPNNATVKVRVRAEFKQAGTQSWDTQVIDNTNGNALYVMDSANINTGNQTSITQNIHAASGWGGSSYTSTRVAAPFHILDLVYDIVEKLKAVDSNLTLSPLKINWSPNNVAQSGNKASGQIGTSHYTNSQIFLLGAANSDTDEYDGHVVIHEWGHYFEDNAARSDSIGGSHGGGDRLDMRVAFGEGFGNAWSGIITDDSFYRDSHSSAQASGFSINVENNSVSNPGWFSEGSVQSILYDIYDSSNDASDSISLGLKSIYDVLVGQQKNTDAFTSIFSFMTYIKQENSANASGLNSLLSAQNIQTNVDIWGANETDDEGQANVLPVYVTLNAGDKKQVCSNVAFGNDWNKLGNHKFVRLNIASAGSHTLRMTPSGANDLDGYIYNKGQLLAFTEDGGTGVANITTNFPAGISVADTLAYNSAGSSIVATCYDVELIKN